uniref:Uncharacterized protein n=1 Tax=Meloidogyne enterolobii TaxID=390850 RepID=A0A6V7YC73_MELEN|nr:unnamed protein product [Meloidogyne enterolobii]
MNAFFTSEVERQSIINCAQNSQIWQTYNSKLKNTTIPTISWTRANKK